MRGTMRLKGAWRFRYRRTDLCQEGGKILGLQRAEKRLSIQSADGKFLSNNHIEFSIQINSH